MPHPKKKEVLQEILTICTSLTPFEHINGDMYVQIDGFSMGSCLGPTFADYYMCEIENAVISEKPECKPSLWLQKN